MHEALTAVRKLEDRELLIRIGVVPGRPAVTDTMFLSFQTVELRKTRRHYGTYHFYVVGWTGIRDASTASVFKIEVQDSGGDVGVGSGFVFLCPNWIVTARHCVENMVCTAVVTSDGRRIEIPPENWSFHPSGADVAVVAVEESIGRPFLPRDPKVLDQVLTLGYPAIPGFEPPLVSELAEVAANLRPLVGSVGNVTATASSYLDGQTYWLITAKVKEATVAAR